MKRIKKIIGLIWLSLFIILIVCSLIVIVGTFNHSTTVLNEKHYNTVDELHENYLISLSEAYYNGDSMTDYYPKEIVTHFEKETDVFVICTYSSSIDGEVNQNALLVYIAKKNETGYYLEVPYLGVGAIYSAVVPLHSDYSHRSYTNNYTEYKTLNSKLCYGFAYKNNHETNSLYFDDIEMGEMKCINPFTDEEFILCYAVSDKVYHFFEMLVVPTSKRHTLKTNESVS